MPNRSNIDDAARGSRSVSKRTPSSPGVTRPAQSPAALPATRTETVGHAPHSGAELTALSAVDAVRSLVQGDIKAEDYCRALLRRCEAGAHLNAFISIRPELALATANECDRKRRSGAKLGRLHGLPICIKDSVNTVDFPTTAGTPGLHHFQPGEDAPIVRALRDQGAIVLGKNNMHELSWGYSNNNEAYGAVRNPYDPTRIAGGSSGGTAASIAYRMAPLGVAEDTEGSIRVPAALSGIAGFRPTTGRYDSAATAPTTPLFDQLGPHARTVSDLFLFDAVLTGTSLDLSPPPLKGIRLGIVRSYFWTRLDPEVERITAAALDGLQRAGIELVEDDFPELDRLIKLVTRPVQYHDFRPTMTRYLAQYNTGLTFEELIAKASPEMQSITESMIAANGSNFVSDRQYDEILKVHLPALHAMYRSYFARARVAAIVFPAAIIPAPSLQSLTREADMRVIVGGEWMSFDAAISRNIAPGSTAGLPGLVLPAGLTGDGVPVALEFDGPWGSDRRLLTLGLALEAELGQLPPPPSV